MKEKTLMQYRFVVACTALFSVMFLLLALQPASAALRGTRFDRAFIIMMENQGFDNVIGHDDSNPACGTSEAPGCPDTPYITYLATHFGLASLYFGTTHPSLPNYVSMFAGSYFGIQDDNPSCAVIPATTPCDPLINGPTLVDTLESAGGSWLAFEETMPTPGFLGSRWPLTGDTLYAMKHNPFVYFKNVVANPVRLAKILPYSSPAQIGARLTNPSTAPDLAFIVPNQCHDMHGQSGCSDNDALLRAGDATVRNLVQTITQSRAFTSNSIIVVVWDENDYSSNLGCCLGTSPVGGGHTVAIIIPGHIPPGPLRSATLYNHYSLLKTFEDNWGLLRLRNTASPIISNMYDLIPPATSQAESVRDMLRFAPVR
jgi:phosphatidylinositol-3-phosphatase